MLRTVGKRLCSSSASCSPSHSVLVRDAVAHTHRVPAAGLSLPLRCSSTSPSGAAVSAGKSQRFFINASRRASAPAAPEFKSFSASCNSLGGREYGGDGRVERPSWSVASSHAGFPRCYASIAVDAGGGGSDKSGGDQGGKGGSGGGGGGGGASEGKGASDQAGGGGFWGWWAWYLAEIDKNPLRAKALTTAVLNLIGDIFCQTVVEKAEAVDWYRTAVLTFLGLSLVGPSLHLWYQLLSRIVKVTGPAGVGVRLVLDQFVFCPVFIGIFLGAIMGLEGNADKFPAKLKAEWFSIVKANWTLWIPAQIINFGFVPLKLQVAVANLTGLLWNGYLSYRSHSSHEVESEGSFAEVKTS